MTAEHRDRAPLNRRGMLAGVAGLVAGAMAARAIQPVAAANGDQLILGNTAGAGAQTATATTTVNATVAGNPALRFTNAFAGSTDANQDSIQGYTVGANNTGIFGRNNDLNGVGTWGASPNGTGAFGESAAGSGVAGSSTSGAGVFGQSTSGYGGQFSGGLAQLYLPPSSGATPPSGTHQIGEFFVASNGTVLYCTVGGATPTFRVAAGPATAGSFHFLSSPDRYVDTRSNIGGVNGPQPPNTTQVFQMTGRAGQNGVVIPAGATAIVGSLIALGQGNALNGSFLTIWAGGAQPPTSNINYGANQVIANTFFSLLSSDGKVSIFNRSDANYVVDVVGYYL